MKTIEINNVSVVFHKNTVIENVSFTVAPGKITIILGPNGSGKTTLLRAIMGLISYTGKILIDGKPVHEHFGGIGYVPQRITFDRTFPITVEEFLGLSLHKHDSAAMHKALEEVDMVKDRKSLLGELSGGQLQRILIARAIMHQPKLLILDEPTSGIDAPGIKDFYEIIEHMNKDHGVTILMVSHEINIVQSFADNVVCLNKNLVCFGNPRKALSGETLSHLYGPDTAVHSH